MAKFLITLPDKHLTEIKKAASHYSSISEFIRQAISYYLHQSPAEISHFLQYPATDPKNKSSWDKMHLSASLEILYHARLLTEQMDVNAKTKAAEWASGVVTKALSKIG